MSSYTVYKHTSPNGKVYIWATCNGKQKTHGGFRWAYEEVVV